MAKAKSAKAKSATSAGKSTAKKSTAKNSGNAVSPKQGIILETIFKLNEFGNEEPTLRQVMIFSRNMKTPEGFKKNLSQLRKGGYLEKGSVVLTSKGKSCVGETSDNPPLSNKTAHDYIMEVLKGKACSIFLALTDGDERERDSLARELGYDMSRLSGYKKDISKLKSDGFLEYPSKSSIRLTDFCFPLGRPTKK